MFLAYCASKAGAAFVDRALYLPRGWTDDSERCREAGIPETVRFATKLTLAQRMLARAFASGVPATGWWPTQRTGDHMLSVAAWRSRVGPMR